MDREVEDPVRPHAPRGAPRPRRRRRGPPRAARRPRGSPRAATDRVPGGRGSATVTPSASSRRARLAPTKPVAPVEQRARHDDSSGSRRRRDTARRAAGSRRAPPATAPGLAPVRLRRGRADRAPRVDLREDLAVPARRARATPPARRRARRRRARAWRAGPPSRPRRARCAARPGNRSRAEERVVLVQRPAQQVARRATAGPAASWCRHTPTTDCARRAGRAPAGRSARICVGVDDDDRAVADVHPLASAPPVVLPGVERGAEERRHVVRAASARSVSTCSQ